MSLALLLSSSSLASRLEAQADPLPVGTYRFTIAVPVTECTFDGAPTGAAPEQVEGGAKFFYVQSVAKDATVVIQFLRYKRPEMRRRFNGEDSAGAPQKYFCLSRSNFERFSRQVFATKWDSRDLAAGALILPVKLRPGARDAGFDFTNDVSFGTSAGIRIRGSEIREEFYSILVGVALSSVSLTKENTSGKVTDPTTKAAFTWTLGVMAEANKFQFGFFVGQDRIAQPNESNWAFQGKTWLGLGLGYALFGGPEKKAATTQTK